MSGLPFIAFFGFCISLPTFCIWLGVRLIKSRRVLRNISISLILIQCAMMAFLIGPHFGFDHGGDWGLDINHQVLGALVYWLMVAGGMVVSIVMKNWWLAAAQLAVVPAVIFSSFHIDFHLPEVQIVAGSVAAATLVREVVRRVNCRDDNRVNHHAPTPDAKSESN